MKWDITFIEEADEMEAVEELQRLVWLSSETDVVPTHLLISSIHNGGLLIGGYLDEKLIGFVFGIPGLYFTPDGPRPKHYSHMLAVHPDFRNQGLGFVLKRAQWQMVRHQGIDLITWTYDPLLSMNARLNITKLGAVSNTYLVDFYGEMKDGLNIGLPSDRLQVNWWVNSQRVSRRLSRRARGSLSLKHYLTADVRVINPSTSDSQGFQRPDPNSTAEIVDMYPYSPIVLFEIPSDFNSMKAADPELAMNWRLHTRQNLDKLFNVGYIVTDFIYDPGKPPRSYYVLSHGESTL